MKKFSVSIVQGNSPCPGAKNNCNDERKRIYESHLNLTRSIQNDKDLIIWPESSTGFTSAAQISDANNGDCAPPQPINISLYQI